MTGPTTDPTDAANAAGVAGRNRAAAIGYLTSFGSGDPDAVAAHVADGFVNAHASALGRGTKGRTAYRAALPGFLSFLDGLTYTVGEVVSEGALVAVTYRLRGTFVGPSGERQEVDVPGMVLLRFDADGKIEHRLDHWDSLTFLRQTGQAS